MPSKDARERARKNGYCHVCTTRKAVKPRKRLDGTPFKGGTCQVCRDRNRASALKAKQVAAEKRQSSANGAAKSVAPKKSAKAARRP